MIVNADNFREELIKILENAKEQGKVFVDISSEELHKQVGGYPGRNHRMPTCCNVMKNMMKPNDKIIQEPLKGKGASLIIRYFLK
ncbi:hypothetical protein [Inconstantimicrobium mannanitabidum]|uniref:Uncharacterized protein n=1 Tax=Inconstantimicrobium mannanitabidum TaxID=1604901 RepID=A0ACB5R7L2_9CLOT|nr:hypothetical protein [Clostridium sp. TW13]GKX65174.1 hypothetical protein rsdtw13_04320 [Clostridium sp. TW13]